MRLGSFVCALALRKVWLYMPRAVALHCSIMPMVARPFEALYCCAPYTSKVTKGLEKLSMCCAHSTPSLQVCQELERQAGRAKLVSSPSNVDLEYLKNIMLKLYETGTDLHRA